jgi:hypothetical protein
MKYFQAVIIIVLSAQNILAQTTSRNVSGNLINSKNEPIEFASALLFSASDSLLIGSSLSDSLGQFSIELPSASQQVYLSIQFLGYQTYNSDKFTGSKNFENLLLKNDGVSLDEVKISYSKPLIEKTGRGLILNVASSPVLNSGNSLEVLRKVPGVIVNQDGSITLKGKPNVMVYIDGKPTYMSLEDLTRFLENTPASDIDNIEVFEVPPPQYEAAGNAGIINITMKKGLKTGVNGNVGTNIGYGNYHKLSPYASINYRNKKINTYGSGWYFNNIGNNVNKAYMNMVDGEEKFILQNTYKAVYHPIGGGTRAGIDWFINDKSTLGFLYMGYAGKSFGVEPSTTNVVGGNLGYDRARANRDFIYFWEGSTYNLNFLRELRKDEKISFDTDFVVRQNSSNQFSVNQLFLNNTSQNPLYVDIDALSDIVIGVAKVDYEKKIKENWNVYAGAKASTVQTTNKMDILEGSDKDNLTPTNNTANNFNYDENIYGVYGNIVGSINDNWRADLGVRIEHTNAEGYSPDADSSFTRNYTNVFPNISINYEIPEKHSYSLSYTSRIDRPNYSNLNPFEAQINQFTFFRGNPLLNAQISNVANFTYGFKQKYFFTLSASITNGAMTRVITQDESIQRQFITIENLDRIENYSLSAVIPIKIKDWWNINFNATGFHNIIKSDFTEGNINKQLWSYSLNMQQIFNLPKGYKIELSGYYNSDSYWNLWFVEPYYQLDFGINKKVKNFNFNFTVSDFLNVREGNGGVFQGDVFVETEYKPESRIAKLNVSYTFGNQKIQQARRRKTGSEDIQKRSGD